MSILSTIKGWIQMLLGKRATKEFDVEVISSAAVDEMIAKCARIYAGNPDWTDVKDHIKTVNFAKAICSETARLATLGIGITIDGSARAKWLQEQIDNVYYQLRHWVEYGCAYGTIILKPNGETVEMYTRGSFEITHQTGGVIDGVIFLNQKQAGKKWYTRLEYHRFVDGLYAITNRCFVGDSKDDTNKQIGIELTPWADLVEEAFIANVDKSLFGVLRTPHANNLCTDSPYALPIFSDAIEELKDLDIAYSRNAKEIRDSKRIVLADDTKLNTNGFSKGANNLKQQFGGLSAVLKKFGGVIAAAFSVKAIASFGKEALELGSDLQEVQNVVDVTFTTMNEKVNEFAQNAAATAGLSETMAKRYVGTFGAMAKSFRFTEESAYAMSTTLTQLVGDVASFYNITQDEAYTKLTAVFTGETEALKNLGVVMTETALNDFALRKGLGKTVNKMSEQEKAALRYQFVLEQLADASGDFIRTQDGWANQTRILNLQFEQLKATIGQGLINVLTPVLKMINTLIARLQQFANAFRDITAALFGKATSGGSGIAESLGSAADSADDLADGITAAGKAAQKALTGFDEITRLTDTAAGGAGTAGGAGGLDYSFPDVSSSVDTDVEQIKTKLEPIISYVQGVISRLKAMLEPLKSIDFSASIESIKGFFGTIAGFTQEAWADLEWVWSNVLVPLAQWSIEEHGPQSVELLTEAFKPLITALQTTREGWHNLVQALQPAVEWIKQTASQIVEKFKKRFQELGEVFREKGGEISETLTNLGIIWGVVWAKLQPILEKIKNAFFAVFDFIGSVSAGTLGDVIDLISGFVQFFAGVLTGDWKKALNGIIKMFNALISNMVTGLNGLIGVLNKIKFNIPDWVPGLGGKSFGINLKTLTTPQIPYLAKGAVIPPNAPFMAVLGDQRNGTNIEAPLSTIQEAVATVMEDYSAANMAGHSATVAVLREILEAVLGIEIGDDVLANAVKRYQTKMAIVRGG